MCIRDSPTTAVSMTSKYSCLQHFSHDWQYTYRSVVPPIFLFWYFIFRSFNSSKPSSETLSLHYLNTYKTFILSSGYSIHQCVKLTRPATDLSFTWKQLFKISRSSIMSHSMIKQRYATLFSNTLSRELVLPYPCLLYTSRCV